LATERIVLLGGTDPSTRMICHALRARWPEVPAIIEALPSRRNLVQRRARKLGLPTVAGQLVFRAALVPVLRRVGARRVREIMEEHRLDDSPIVGDVIRVTSANDPETHAHLRRLAPAVVVLNGTRILSKETLSCVDAPFINTHAGITPFCRGVHGGYWALAERRPDLVGTTVHVVDTGIDTGQVLAQATFRPTPDDSFATYPVLHTAHGIPLLLEAVAAALEGRLTPRPSLVAGPSVLRSHPTAWGYLWRRVTAGVR
jgi:folate-dependent phosphoribosylglycinamide formyltransferase PurN